MTLGTLTVPTVIVIILGVQGVIMGVLEFISGFRGGGFGVIHSRGDKAPCRLQAPSARRSQRPRRIASRPSGTFWAGSVMGVEGYCFVWQTPALSVA